MKLAFTVQYNGKNYFGFQKQKHLPTIQSKLEETFSILFRQPIKIFSAGRTDRGVSALAQVIHFSLEKTSPLVNNMEKLIYAANSILPSDISLQFGKIVAEEFHARFSCLQRKYVYLLYNAPVRSALLHEQTLWLRYPLDIEAMRQAAKLFIGEKDFAAFTLSSYLKNKEKTIRRIDQIEIETKEHLLSFYFCGSGFLHNMIRIITGTLVEVGKGKINEKMVQKILDSKDRRLAGKTLPPHALFFVKASYENYP